MTDLARPAITELHAWHAQQNPLFRALAEPMVTRVTETLTAMQTVVDRQASLIDDLTTRLEQLEAKFEGLHAATRARLASVEASAATQVEAAECAARAQVELVQTAAMAQAAEHAIALRVTTDRIDQLERNLYGAKSERSERTPDARRDAQKRRKAELSEQEWKARREAAAKARQAQLAKLRTKTLIIPLGADVPPGRPLPALSSTLFEWHPGELVRLVVVREQRVLADGGITTAPPPPQVIEGGSYGPALHAKIVVSKCLDAMPLRRQERAFERIGAPLPVSVLCALFHRAAGVIKPLYEALVAQIGTDEHVSADETPQPVLDEDKVRKGWMWVFATEEGIVYAYSPSRGGAVPDGILGRSKGTLTVDGHTGYNLVTRDGRRERGGCWSHGRRGLFEARGYAESLVDGWMAQIGELFYIEQLAIERQIVGTEAHLALRKERSEPVITQLFASVEVHIGDFDSRSRIAKAMQYLLNQRAPLSLFLKDPRVPLHNNLSERALRIVALLRKNALFVGNDESGENLAMLLSMVATCRMHQVDPERWLADVLVQISEPGTTAEDLLPWNWKTGRGTWCTPAFDTT